MAGQDPYAAAYAGQPTAADLLCIRCAAPLESEAADAVCGLCGLKVVETTRRVLLKANPVYVGNLRLSLGLYIGLQIGIAGFGLMTGLTNVVLSMLSISLSGVMYVTTVIGLLLGLTMQYTYWRLTEADQEYPENHLQGGARLVLRVSIAVACVFGLASTTVVLILMPDILSKMATVPVDGKAPLPTFDASMILAVWVPALAGFAIAAVQTAALSSYLASLARRLPDPQLVQRSQMYVWLMPVLNTVGILACGLGPLVATVLMVIHVYRLRGRIAVPRMTTASMFG